MSSFADLHFETGKYKEPINSTFIPNADGAKEIYTKGLEAAEWLASLDIDWEREGDQLFSRLPEMDDLWRLFGLSINQPDIYRKGFPKA